MFIFNSKFAPIQTPPGSRPNGVAMPPPYAAAQPPSQKSWSPDLHRDEEWIKRKGKHNHRRSKSVTDEDINELKACIELGFGFEHALKLDDRLSDTLPALGFYHAVNKQYFDTKLKSSTSSSSSVSSYSYAVSEPDLSSQANNPHTIFCQGNLFKFIFGTLLGIVYY
ncbi:hypothetical protein HanPI659440_Chr07g0265911 [Helianthus annuus]|nr:hypothetical protein HanPI659440_Chr07g0265911 [Helianthus annuus]